VLTLGGLGDRLRKEADGERRRLSGFRLMTTQTNPWTLSGWPRWTCAAEVSSATPPRASCEFTNLADRQSQSAIAARSADITPTLENLLPSALLL
jgi:hypothetical protein